MYFPFRRVYVFLCRRPAVRAKLPAKFGAKCDLRSPFVIVSEAKFWTSRSSTIFRRKKSTSRCGEHDSLAWAASPLGIRVEGGDLPRPFFLSGDNAFTEAPHMVTPVGDSDCDFYQSSNRMPIECGEMLQTLVKIMALAYISRFRVCATLGMLIRRFGVIWRPLEVKFKRRAPLIAAIMRLHKYCIDRRIALELREVNGCTEMSISVYSDRRNGEPAPPYRSMYLTRLR